ncbi:MAG: glycosyltransferase family 87 protein [Planctomycetota bacterium]|jgi:hypothetical protein
MTAAPPALSGRTRVARALIALVILNAALIPVFAFRGTTELDVYLLAAERLVQGDPIYRGANDIVPAFTYPPLFAFIVTPLVILSENGARVAWCIVQVTLAATLVAALWIVLRPRLHDADRSRASIDVVFWIVMTLIGLRFLLSPLENQSHDLFVATFVTAGVILGARGRDGMGGALLGVAAALKATPLLFLPMLVLQRRWRAAGAMTVSIAVSSVLPDLVMRPDAGKPNVVQWAEFASGSTQPGIDGAAHVWLPWNKLNQNLAGTIYRLTASPAGDVREPDVAIMQLGAAPRKLLTLTLQGAIFLGVLAVCWQSGRIARIEPAPDHAAFFHRRLGEAGVIACGMILLSPMSSKAHFCVLLIGVAVAATEFARRPRPALGVLLALIVASSTLTAKGIIGTERGNYFLALGTTMFSVVLLLAALIPALVRRNGPLAVP